ncbi:MAG: hypothetical protein ABFD10_17585 [Prolixibacteraceae bacterium]
MAIKKILLAGIAGAVVYFLLGWLFYGILLMNFMTENAGSATGVAKEPMLMWALALGDLFWGFLLAVIFGCWTNIRTWLAGAKAGAIIGLLMGAGIDLMMYGTSNLYNCTALVVDVIVVIIMTAIVGAVVAAILGSGGKNETEE